MAQTPWTGLLTGSSTPLLASGDVVAFVDVSDTTQSASGSLVKATLTQYFAAIPVPINILSTSANALAVGRLGGTTTPAFVVDASTASQVAGFKVVGAVTGGTVALVAIDSGADTNVTFNAKGTGTIGIGSVSTGRVTITPVTTITGSLTLSAALVYGGVTLSNAVTGTGNMVLSANPTTTGTLTCVNLAATTVATTDNIAIGTAFDDEKAVVIKGTITAGTSQYGLMVESVANSTATTAGYGIEVRVVTDAAAFTMTNAYGVYIGDASKGAGSAITNYYGLYIVSPTAGGTLNRAIYVAGGTSEFQAVTATALSLSTGARVTKNGSDTELSGPYLVVENAAQTRRYTWQLADTASDNLRLFFYNGSATNIATFTGSGGLTVGTPSGGTAASWKFGAVSVTSPTSPNRTIELDVNGTIYYLHAKTTNN